MRPALFVLCSLGLSSSAFAYTRLQNDAGTDMAMPHGECAVVLAPLPEGASFDRATFEAAVDRAIAAWSAVPGLPVRLVRTETPSPDRPVIFVADHTMQWSDDARYLALSAHASKARAGTIVSVDTEIDDVFHSFSDVDRDPDAARDHRHDLAAVLTHELGHALGLGHSTDPHASMYPDIVAGDPRARFLGDDDRAGIAAIYGAQSAPADAVTTEGADAPAPATQPASACSMGGHATGSPAAFAALFFAFAAAVARGRATRRAPARTA